MLFFIYIPIINAAFDELVEKRNFEARLNVLLNALLYHLRWFRSYLINRTQRVTVLGAASNPLPVISGVPPLLSTSILGPALFLLFVNDLPSTVKSSQVVMFADDTKVFKEIRTENDAKQPQNDISNLESWSTTSGLSFNGTKCKAQTVTRKLKPITTSYTMKDCQLTSTKTERDLGAWISTDLKWSKQVNQQCVRANKELRYIMRNIRTLHNTTTRRTIYQTIPGSRTFTSRLRDPSVDTSVGWITDETRENSTACDEFHP